MHANPLNHFSNGLKINMANLKNYTQKLKNPPVSLGICQIMFDGDTDLIRILTPYKSLIKHNYPQLHENIEAKIDVPSTISLGVSELTTKTDASLKSMTFKSSDGKKRFSIFADSLIYENEEKYIDWDNFTKDLWNILSIINDKLIDKNVIRLSIRFVNTFVFKEFNEPYDYFKVMISQSDSYDNDLSFPVARYGFNLTQPIPNSKIYCIQNHNLSMNAEEEYLYIFDIDVLNKDELKYNIQDVKTRTEELKNIRNNLFFGAITDKTISLCN